MYRRPPFSLDTPPLLFPSRTSRASAAGPVSSISPDLPPLPLPGAAFPEAGFLASAHHPLLPRRPGTCLPGPPSSRAHTCSFRRSVSLRPCCSPSVQPVLAAQVSVKPEGEARVLPVLNCSHISFTWGVRRRGGAPLISTRSRARGRRRQRMQGKSLRRESGTRVICIKLNQDPHHQPLV